MDAFQEVVAPVSIVLALDASGSMTRAVDDVRAAARSFVEDLTALGLMRGDPAEAVAHGAHALFFPHGLGHMMGMDVHDMENLGEDIVGYGPEFERSPQFGLGYLRLARRLEPGFVLTVEPGLYFIPALIGLFAIPQVIDGMRAGAAHVIPRFTAGLTALLPTWRELVGLNRSMLVGSAVGTGVGAATGCPAHVPRHPGVEREPPDDGGHEHDAAEHHQQIPEPPEIHSRLPQSGKHDDPAGRRTAGNANTGLPTRARPPAPG